MYINFTIFFYFFKLLFIAHMCAHMLRVCLNIFYILDVFLLRLESLFYLSITGSSVFLFVEWPSSVLLVQFIRNPSRSRTTA